MVYKKGRQKKPRAIPVKRGCRIILKKGKGPKHKYNGREVSVVEYPPRGGWMTVGFRGSAIKWRKGQYLVESVAAQSKKLEQRMDQVDDNVWTNIFSYLVGPSSDGLFCHDSDQDHSPSKRISHNDLIWVKDAQKIHSTLTAVCERWRSSCNNNMAAIFGLINANLDALPEAEVVPCMHWMIKRKVSLGALNFSAADYGDFRFLEQLLNYCDTSNLKFMRARRRRHSDANEYHSCWISTAYEFQKGGRTIDLTNGCSTDTYQNMCKVLDVPYPCSPPKLQQLHDAIAFNCKNVSELQINIDLPEKVMGNNIQDFLSEALFSLESIRTLELSLDVIVGASSIIERILKKLVNLQHLSLSSPRGNSSSPKRVHIASTRLRSLNVSNFGKEVFISGDLPKLKSFTHRLYNGIVPQFGHEQPMVRFNHDDQPYFHADQAIIYGLKIPSKCRVINYDVYSTVYDLSPAWRLRNFRNAPLF